MTASSPSSYNVLQSVQPSALPLGAMCTDSLPELSIVLPHCSNSPKNGDNNSEIVHGTKNRKRRRTRNRNDSDNDNDNDTDIEDGQASAALATREKKPVRTRRAKKSKVAATVGGELSRDVVSSGRAADDQQQKSEVVGGGKSVPTVLILPPTPPSQDTPSAALSVSNVVLGKGSNGTIVFEGSLQGRAVAVKRVQHQFIKYVSREVSILEESDDHPNIIRYFFYKPHGDFLYIALELCPASLSDIIDHPGKFKEITERFQPQKALRQVGKGLQHMHRLEIVHRDIKPQNILISWTNRKGATYKISDFGLCKRLEPDRSSFDPTVHGAGTIGWKAPEIIRHSTMSPMRLTKSVDIFALGCVYYYWLTKGKHPFGRQFARENNILLGASCLDGLETVGEEDYLAKDMISKMLNANADQRPNISTCLRHPYFSSPGTRLNFLLDAADWFETMRRWPTRPDVLIKLEQNASEVVGDSWKARVDKCFLENLVRQRRYNDKSVQDLMRAIRNKKHYYHALPADVQRQLGDLPDGYLSYFTRRFPKLVVHVHDVVVSSHECPPLFKTYF